MVCWDHQGQCLCVPVAMEEWVVELQVCAQLGAGDLVASVAVKKHGVTADGWDFFTSLALLGLGVISTACMAPLEPGKLLCAESSAAAGIVPR